MQELNCTFSLALPDLSDCLRHGLGMAQACSGLLALLMHLITGMVRVLR
jgi:hypothetical protein